jgi:lipopolysaccharide transport system ATP-binding protein
MEIASVRLLNEDGIAVDELASGRPLSIQIEYQAQQPISSPIFSVTISKEDGSVCFDVSTETAGIVTPALGEAGQITLSIDRLDLTRGVYFIDVGVYERAWAYAYDYHWHVYPIRVLSAMGGMGILNLPHHWTMNPPLSQ